MGNLKRGCVSTKSAFFCWLCPKPGFLQICKWLSTFANHHTSGMHPFQLLSISRVCSFCGKVQPHGMELINFRQTFVNAWPSHFGLKQDLLFEDVATVSIDETSSRNLAGEGG